MIKILKASAGSGKTYNLAKEYIRLLMNPEDAYAYRHILAVTFTNKATDEMKQRILDELYTLANTPKDSPYYREFTAEGMTDIQKKAESVLCNILHDYSAFSVSTIDKFFQRAVRAFSREIGQFSSYQVELDVDSLMDECVDRIMDTLTEDNRNLLGWLTDNTIEQLRDSGKFDIDDKVKKMAKSLKSDEYKDLVEKCHFDEEKGYSTASLKELKETCRKVVAGYVERLKRKAGQVLEIIGKQGLSTDDFAYRFPRDLYDYREQNANEKVERPNDRFMKLSANPDGWFPKAKAKLLPRVDGILNEPLADFCALFDAPYREYMTARLLLEQIYKLGVIADINRVYGDLLKEKNIISLNDSNTILKDIIDGSDTPFVYEKLGVRYEHFLLDEFQDTSKVQWENFRPLLKESDDSNNYNLIVGDVKQSIYRWRGSDWNLLANKLQEQFPRSEVDNLDSNFRSLASVVEFNNDFYPYAATLWDRAYPDLSDNGISRIYSDVRQNVTKAGDDKGNVDVVFCQGDQLLIMIRQVVEDLLKHGARYSDIGILVRSNNNGSDVAGELLSHGMPVVSDDSLKIKSSPTVIRLVSLLSSVNNPADKLNQYLVESLNVKPVDEWHSLTDLAEHFVRELKEQSADGLAGESSYIQAFMDYLQDWVKVNGNSLSGFLSDFEAKDQISISSPDGTDAIRVMTIHKSKGLAFKYVIYPIWCSKPEVTKPSEHWCVPDLKGTPMEGVGEKIFRIDFSKDTAGTCFSDSYWKEIYMSIVDAMNTCYVATTRARKGMTVISKMPSSDFVKGLDAFEADPSKVCRFTDMSQILYWYARRRMSRCLASECPVSASEEGKSEPECYRNGSLHDFSKEAKGTEKQAVVSGTDMYPSFSLDGRLQFSEEASDFFSDEGVGMETSDRLRGIVLHSILSKIKTPSQLEAAVDAEYYAGSISEEERIGILQLLRPRVDAAVSRGWFPEDTSMILNETSVIDADGEIYRPDRVIVNGKEVTVIDYKFGEARQKYYRQVDKYKALYKDMGYTSVKGYLWYVGEDKVVEV